VSLTEGDTASYSVTLDATGKETAREPLTAPNRGGGAGRAAAAPAAGGGAAPARAGAAPAPPAATAAAPPPRGTQQGSAGRRAPTLKNGDWNEAYITIGQEGPPSGSASGTNGPVEVLSTYGTTSGVDEKNATAYGAIALYVGGTGEVRYKDLAWKDLMSMIQPKEVLSNRYTIQRLTIVYYGRATTADINRDGNLDVILGPFYSLDQASRTRDGIERAPSTIPRTCSRGHGQPRRRLHRRRMARHSVVARQPSHGSVREPEGRLAPGISSACSRRFPPRSC
jgi:hypothetical protein